MESNEKNFSGRIFAPWYDTDLACYIFLIFLSLTFLFGIAGIFAAIIRYNNSVYLRIPVMLTTASIYTILSVLIRLITRKKINSKLKSSYSN